MKIMRSEVMRIQHELQNQKDKIKENTEKIKVRLIEYSILKNSLTYMGGNFVR